jgi:hypothetical protein
MGMMRDGGKTWTEGGEQRASEPTLADCNHSKGREKAASGQTHPAACLALGPPNYTRTYIVVHGACWLAVLSSVQG